MGADTETLDAALLAIRAGSGNAFVSSYGAKDVMTWSCAHAGGPGGLTLSEVIGLQYEGSGLWRLPQSADVPRIRLYEDQIVVGEAAPTDAGTLLATLAGDGTRLSAAHSLVLVEPDGSPGAICEVATFLEPILDRAVRALSDPPNPLDPRSAGVTVLSCRNALIDTYLRFDLRCLLEVSYCGNGVFELPGGTRFGVLAPRPVTPERKRQHSFGFVLPVLEFRPPAAPLN